MMEENFVISHGIAVIHKDNIKDNIISFDDIEHFCGYDEEPQDWSAAKKLLLEELVSDFDRQFDDLVENYVFMKANKEIINTYKSIYAEEILPQVKERHEKE